MSPPRGQATLVERNGWVERSASAYRCGVTEYGRRTRRLPAPPRVVWADLADPKREGVRAWLDLLPDEVGPAVFDPDPPKRLIWSSLWPSRPDDRIVFELEDRHGETALTFILLSAGDPPDDSKAGHIRKRMSQLLFAQLRYTYGQ